MRGTGRSGGRVHLLRSGQEAADGVELVDWVANELDGSNCVLCVSGCSCLDMKDFFTAGSLPHNSPVQAITPFCAGAETYREGWMGNGMPAQTANVLPAFGGLPRSEANCQCETLGQPRSLPPSASTPTMSSRR